METYDIPSISRKYIYYINCNVISYLQISFHFYINKMKRARIKAMVTVPLRRKATQDSSVTETVDVTECDEKDKSKSDDICLALQETSENNFQQKQIQENLVTTEQVQNEQLCHSNENIQCKDEFKERLAESKKETMQSSENSNTLQIGKYYDLYIIWHFINLILVEVKTLQKLIAFRHLYFSLYDIQLFVR